MQRPDAQASDRAWGWLAALLDGSTTPWSEWSGGAEPRLPFLPAAQQLEAVRRLNLVAATRGRPATETVHALLSEGITDRNRGDLPLIGEPGRRFGPPAIDPSALPARDLLPVLAGPLARRLAAVPEPVRRRPLPFVHGFRLYGDPWATAYLDAEQVRRRRSRPGHRALVLAGDLGTLAVHAWAEQAVSGGVIGLRAWLRERVHADRLPRSLDLVAQARRAAAEVGRSHTTVVVDTSRVPRLGAPPPLDPVAVDLARWVGRPLGLLVPARRRRRLLQHVLIPRATRDTAPIALDEPWHGRLTDAARRQRERLSAAGYPVLGSLDALLPPSARPTPPHADGDLDADAVDRALDLLLDPQLDPLEGVTR